MLQDLVGAAETGSGKTLAFGLPILQRLLQIEDKEKKVAETGRAMKGGKVLSTGGRKKGASPLRALIMTPTRELALQVRNTFRKL
jgi:ATP-dependent RNA helicase DDX24/MAK5